MKKWTKLEDENLEHGKNVLVAYKTEPGRKVTLIAAYFGRYELESDDDGLF